jgi:hypothetical protein
VDNSGNIYVADTGNCLVRKITSTGTVTTLAGSYRSYGYNDGTGANASFYAPAAVAVDGAGYVYVTDGVIRKISPGGVVTTLAGTGGVAGYADGTGASVKFNNPSGVAIDGIGNVYVADMGNQLLRKITSGGVVTTLAGRFAIQGNSDGTGANALFANDSGVAVDSGGTLYVADRNNNTIRKATSTGTVTTWVGKSGLFGHVDGPGAAATFNLPTGVALDGVGNIYVVGPNDPSIRKITSSGVVSTLAAIAGYSYGVAVDGAGVVYLADVSTNTIRKITPNGVVTTLAGTGGVQGHADGTGVAASFNMPTCVAVDGAGNVYVADSNNHTIRKITPAGVVTTLAGAAGVPGSVDGTGGAARFNFPNGIAADNAGNVYVADMNNNAIRRITPVGVVTTFVGSGPGEFNFSQPEGVAVDGAGNVYVADTGRNRICRVTSAGVVTILTNAVGNVGYSDGPGSGANFSGPVGMVVDAGGDLYIADAGNATIRKGTPRPVFTTPPESQSVTAADSVTFSAASTGWPAPTYQWYKDGGAIDGANSSTYSIASVAARDAGSYTVVATNTISSTTSDPAVLTVLPNAAAPGKTLGDFDGDGKADLIWTNTQTGERSMWLMNGSGMKAGATLGVVPVEWVVSATADFDGDGKADIFWTNTVTGDRAIWLMNGSVMQTNTFMGTVPTDWVISGTGDFDGDGKRDLVWTNTTTGDRAMWLMNGTVVKGGGYLGTVPVEWSISGVGDFDGDGKADLIWSNTVTGEHSMWLQNGSTTVGGATLNTVPVAWVISGVGDFNRDGKADVFLTNTTTGDRVIWLMNVSTITTNAFMGTVPLDWTVSGTGDFDGDQKKDLFWTNTVTGDRAMWLLNGVTVTGGGFMGTVPVIWHLNY